ncbi:4a-hydroxytetrahydrobiopterin dehydratase [Massilia glaciei]|uniref:Putative pterin-4-alpha-carbinolamine dehydratase n=1 Tax=Massilia glaciei TaxID=1524097 RepID=A0A2U2HEV8_9BURK|nr:4a-hydroxytetrahydrobiopterin dehydratase [Massilia glaciei]PWF42443.1 4a-hydroxytetrahydrobiopterin dehydratase [Massilia glaciei]
MTLLDQHCTRAATALPADAITALLAEVPGWTHTDGKIVRAFALRDYHETIAFVNLLAAMVHEQDHHPDLLVTYKECEVGFSTHSVDGISQNDFICAARANALYAGRPAA